MAGRSMLLWRSERLWPLEDPVGELLSSQETKSYIKKEIIGWYTWFDSDPLSLTKLEWIPAMCTLKRDYAKQVTGRPLFFWKKENRTILAWAIGGGTTANRGSRETLAQDRAESACPAFSKVLPMHIQWRMGKTRYLLSDTFFLKKELLNVYYKLV